MDEWQLKSVYCPLCHSQLPMGKLMVNIPMKDLIAIIRNSQEYSSMSMKQDNENSSMPDEKLIQQLNVTDHNNTSESKICDTESFFVQPPILESPVSNSSEVIGNIIMTSWIGNDMCKLDCTLCATYKEIFSQVGSGICYCFHCHKG
jgi:hypothetical protein